MIITWIRLRETGKPARTLLSFPFGTRNSSTKEIIPFDTLYALHDTFHLSAAAEVQYPNPIQELYEHEPEVARKSYTHTSSMLNLQHFKKVC
jgi:hypothetical protein